MILNFLFKLFKSVFNLMTTKPLPWSTLYNLLLDREFLGIEDTFNLFIFCRRQIQTREDGLKNSFGAVVDWKSVCLRAE